MVRGIRSPVSLAFNITNWPGFALFAILGAFQDFKHREPPPYILWKIPNYQSGQAVSKEKIHKLIVCGAELFTALRV
jgi:hypothetical protein